MSRNRYPDNERDVLSTALHVISTERDALTHLECLYSTNELAQKNMERAVSQLVHTINRGGKLVVCGVGKSGKIGRKLEATMNSVGIHSVFLHPTEALHGDLGVIRSIDTLLLISFSGRTAELLLMLPHVPPTVSIIAITSHTHPSTCPLLSFNSPDMSILLPAPLHVDEESSFGLSAPTSSTTVALALGDALALAAAQKLHTVPGQGPAEVFKGFHPGGAIGAAVATAAAINSAISTPSTSMTTSPSLASLEDVRNKLSLDDSSVTTSVNSKAELLCTAEHFVAADCIPTVPPSQQSEKEVKGVPIRILDILLCAIQNPTSKSWLKLSDTQIIPPTLLRDMTQTHAQKTSRDGNASYYKIDAPISDLCGLITSVDATEWIPMRASTSIEEAKSILEDMRDITNSMLSGAERYQDSDAHQRHKYIVISIVDDNDSDRILGFVAGEDIYPCPCFSPPNSR